MPIAVVIRVGDSAQEIEDVTDALWEIEALLERLAVPCLVIGPPPGQDDEDDW